MRVLGKNRLVEFTELHGEVRPQLDAWRCEAESASWKTPNDIKERYANASILRDNRVVFNIRGNRFRLEVKVDYNSGVVLIIRLGTHAEYSRWK